MFVPVSESEPEPEFEPDLSEYEDTGQSLDSASLAVARISNVCINTWNRWVTKGMSQPRNYMKLDVCSRTCRAMLAIW
jgi:hypothetical protein